jgi:hypothetical protein
VVIAPSNANERGCRLNLLITRVPMMDEKKEKMIKVDANYGNNIYQKQKNITFAFK